MTGIDEEIDKANRVLTVVENPAISDEEYVDALEELAMCVEQIQELVNRAICVLKGEEL